MNNTLIDTLIPPSNFILVIRRLCELEYEIDRAYLVPASRHLLRLGPSY